MRVALAKAATLLAVAELSLACQGAEISQPRSGQAMVADAEVTVSNVGFPRRGMLDGVDALLAALGNATLDCIGTVDPTSYAVSNGALERTFRSCTTESRSAMQQIDALLGVQHSREGRADGLGRAYAQHWQEYVRSFPSDAIRACPSWTLLGLIDEPTAERVRRYAGTPRIGKQNARYLVKSTECPDRRCATDHAIACAAAFGAAFIVGRDARMSEVVVDPVWWLTDYEYPDDSNNPFKTRGYYHAMSYYGSIPGALYAAVQRAGERCSKWGEINKKHYHDRKLVAIDCGGGWYCMSYCT